MLVRPSLFSFSSYPGPAQRKTGTEIVDDFLLVSLEKKQKRILDCLPTAGIFSKILADPDGVSPFFTSAQLYSPEITVDKDKVFELLSASRAREAEPLSKNCICSSATLVEPCDPSGLNRVIKLGRLDSLRSPEHRSSIFVLFDQFHLISDVFPVSRYYYKIRLTPGASDDSLIKILKEFNQGMGKDGPLFHSIFDGKDTRSLLFRFPAPSRGVGLGRDHFPRRIARPSALVVLDPPFQLKLSHVALWAYKSLEQSRPPRWGFSPEGSTCIIVEFFPDFDYFDPKSLDLTLDGEKLKVLYFENGLPSSSTWSLPLLLLLPGFWPLLSPLPSPSFSSPF